MRRRPRPSLIYETCVRFDALKAIGVSRHAEKRRLRAMTATAAPGVFRPLAGSTGRIHADKTLDTYKHIALRYAHWARETHGIRRLADLDRAAEQTVTLYLVARMEAGDSAHALATIRSALRMFHRPAFPASEREQRVAGLGAGVRLPVRRREEITRSRHAVAMDRAIALHRYSALVDFCRATGLRRRELAALTVGQVRTDGHGHVTIHVWNGKGGKKRVVPVLDSRRAAVWALVHGRASTESVVPHVVGRLDVQEQRRLYARDLYCEDGRRVLPPSQGRLPSGSVDQGRARYVARALGHERSDVVVRHYLR